MLIFHKYSLLLLAAPFLFMAKCKMSVQVFSDTFLIHRNWTFLVLCTRLLFSLLSDGLKSALGPGPSCIPAKGEGFRAALVTT